MIEIRPNIKLDDKQRTFMADAGLRYDGTVYRGPVSEASLRIVQKMLDKGLLHDDAPKPLYQGAAMKDNIELIKRDSAAIRARTPAERRALPELRLTHRKDTKG